MLDTKLTETSLVSSFRAAQIWSTTDRASCRISLFLVCFRFHVFSDLAFFIWAHFFEEFI